MTVLALRAKRSKRTIPGAVKWKKKKGTKDRKMFKKEAVGWVVVHDKRHKQNKNTENHILDVSVLSKEEYTKDTNSCFGVRKTRRDRTDQSYDRKTHISLKIRKRISVEKQISKSWQATSVIRV